MRAASVNHESTAFTTSVSFGSRRWPVAIALSTAAISAPFFAPFCRAMSIACSTLVYCSAVYTPLR
jgi:hypothetical protein